MSLAKTQKEVYNYCAANDYVSPEVIESFRERLERDGEIQTLSFALEDFLDETCPSCSASGAFKFHFLGKLKHRPGCSWSWFVSPGKYIAIQLSKVFRAGADAGASMSSEADKKGDKAGGCLGAIFGFIFVALFRLFFAILMIPIQAIFSLTQSKPQRSAAAKQ